MVAQFDVILYVHIRKLHDRTVITGDTFSVPAKLQLPEAIAPLDRRPSID